jgi:putative DNA primase/helicase
LATARPRKRSSATAKSSPAADWPAIEATIYATLGPEGILSLYKSIGVQFSTGAIKASGKVECYSLLRPDDTNPSAYVDANTGKYKDSGDENAFEVNWWDLAAQKGMWAGDWRKAREYAGQLAGVEVPVGGSGGGRKPSSRKSTTPRKQKAAQPAAAASANQPTTPAAPAEDWRTALTFEPWTEGRLRLLDDWCARHKPGVTREAFLAAGGRFARYRKSGVSEETGQPWEREWSVYCLPVYGEAILSVIRSSAAPTDDQLTAATTAYVCWSRNPSPNGDPLTRWDARTKTAVPIKMKAIGSTDGIFGRAAILRLAAHHADRTATPIEAIWKVEGPTDLLTLYASISDANTRDRFPILAVAGTATQFNAWHAELFRGLPQANVIHDADVAGAAGARKVCRALAGVVGKVVLRELPYPVERKHGRDLRDYLNAGNSYFDVCQLNAWEDAWKDDGGADEETIADDVETSSAAESADDIDIAPTIFDPLSLACESGRTETASARRFVNAFPNQLRYCQPWKSWFYWDGKRWKCDKECHVQGLAKSYAESLWREITTVQADDHTAAELEKFAKRSNTKLGIENIMVLARSEPGVPVLVDQFDRQHTLLNVENGVLNLETGELAPHDPTLMLSKIAPVTYDPAAECPTWLRFIAEITAPVDEPASLPPPEDAGDAYEPPPPPSGTLVKEYLQRLAGWCLTGLIRDHAMPFFYGAGANGKSTFLNMLLEILGPDYAMKAPPELIMVRGRDAHPTERADLFGKRMVITNEVDEGRRLAEGLVKDLTGSDSIRARRMNEDFWEFRPTHKLIVAGNHKPTVRGMDEGLWRRIKLVPFNRVFAKHERDESLPEKLAAERSGILNWCLAGCRAWFANGLPEPEIIATATNEYRSEQDIIGNFLTEKCVVADWARVRCGQLYTSYKEWCEESNERPMTQTKFGNAMKNERRFGEKTSNGKWYLGVTLRADATSDVT